MIDCNGGGVRGEGGGGVVRLRVSCNITTAVESCKVQHTQPAGGFCAKCRKLGKPYNDMQTGAPKYMTKYALLRLQNSSLMV